VETNGEFPGAVCTAGAANQILVFDDGWSSNTKTGQYRKSSQNIAFRGFTGKILSPKDLRAAEGGWESPGETRFGNSTVVTVTYQTLLKDTKGQERRARRILPYKQSMGLVGNAVKLRK
jgi:hypothetical protein